MEQISDFFNFLLSSEDIITTGGLIAIFVIILLENGFFFGFFLPGDYLLFLAGVFCATGVLPVHIYYLMLVVFAASVIGSYCGYIFGKYFSVKISEKKDSIFFKQKYITNTEKYFNKYGKRTLIIARFLPIIRTFAPILAGLAKMNFSIFSLYNVIGGALWTLLLVGGGYVFGVKFPGIINYVHYIVIFFLIITTVTAIKGYFNAKKEFS